MKKIMICLNLNDQSELPYIEFFKDINLKKTEEIHFIHAIHRFAYNHYYFIEANGFVIDYKKLENNILEDLIEFGNKIIPKECKAKLFFKCISTDSPKPDIINYSIEKGIDNILIATRRQKQIFSSSFTDYMVRHSTCSLSIIRMIDSRDSLVTEN